MSENPPAVSQIPVSGFVAAEFEIAAALREWRHCRALEDDVPAYVVLPNRLLQDIARELPQDEESLRRLKGMGPTRLARYAPSLLARLRELGATGSAGAPPAAYEREERTDFPPSEVDAATEQDVPVVRQQVGYRVAIEYHLEDEARQQLVAELSCGLGPLSVALCGALARGPARVRVRIESDHTTAR